MMQGRRLREFKSKRSVPGPRTYFVPKLQKIEVESGRSVPRALPEPRSLEVLNRGNCEAVHIGDIAGGVDRCRPFEGGTYAIFRQTEPQQPRHRLAGDH
jgi:hypothetical protein